jgi:hypothetical protein
MEGWSDPSRHFERLGYGEAILKYHVRINSFSAQYRARIILLCSNMSIA